MNVLTAACLAACLSLGCRGGAGAELAEGERLLSLGKAAQANTHFQKALERRPSARAHRGAGLAAERLGTYGVAREHLQAAVEGDPKDLSARLGLVRIASRLRQPQAALLQLDSLARLAPADTEVLLLRGLYARDRATQEQLLAELRALPPPCQELLLLTTDLERRVAANAPASKKPVAALHSPELSVRTAIVAQQLGRWELSAALLEAVLAKHPDNSVASRWLVEAYLALARPRRAREVLRRMPATESGEWQLLQARVLLADRQVLAARKLLREQHAQAPASAEGRGRGVVLALAEAERRAGEEDAARNLLSPLLSDPLMRQPAWVGLAEMAKTENDCTALLGTAQSLSEHERREEAVAIPLARCQLTQGDRVGAEQTLRPLLDLQSAPKAALLLLAGPPQEQGQAPARDAVLEHLQRFPRHAPSWTHALLWLAPDENARKRALRERLEQLLPTTSDAPQIAATYALWLARGGLYKPARKRLREILETQPDELLAVRSLLTLYRTLGKTALCHTVIDNAVSANPRSRSLRLTAAWALAQMGDTQGSLAQLEAAQSHDPAHPRVHSTWALVASEFLNDAALARKHLDEARKADPNGTDTLDAYGWLAHLSGETERGLPSLETVVRREPHNPLFRYHLGAALLSRGQYAEARRQLRAVIELDPLFYRAQDVRKALRDSPTSP